MRIDLCLQLLQFCFLQKQGLLIILCDQLVQFFCHIVKMMVKIRKIFTAIGWYPDIKVTDFNGIKSKNQLFQGLVYNSVAAIQEECHTDQRY